MRRSSAGTSDHDASPFRRAVAVNVLAELDHWFIILCRHFTLGHTKARHISVSMIHS